MKLSIKLPKAVGYFAVAELGSFGGYMGNALGKAIQSAEHHTTQALQNFDPYKIASEAFLHYNDEPMLVATAFGTAIGLGVYHYSIRGRGKNLIKSA